MGDEAKYNGNNSFFSLINMLFAYAIVNPCVHDTTTYFDTFLDET
jgi:hypothetical protein